MDYELYIEVDKKVIDVFAGQLRKFGLNPQSHTIRYLWDTELRDTVINAMNHNSNLVIPISFFSDEISNTYLRLEHDYVILSTGSTYISNLRLCNKIEDETGAFNEIVLYGVYCKPVK